MEAKMLSALLTGVNRAFHYAKGMKLQRITNTCLIETLQIHEENHSLLEDWRPWRSGGLLSPTVNSRYLPLPVDNTAVHSKFTGTHIPRMDRFLSFLDLLSIKSLHRVKSMTKYMLTVSNRFLRHFLICF